jgi:hypothetical protein
MEELALTKFATASSPSVIKSARPRAARYAACAALLAAGLVALAGACKSSKGAASDAGAVSATCKANIQSSSGNATKLISGTAVTNGLCFEGESEWYVITVPSGNTLLDVTAGYPPASDTQVQLDVKVFFKTSGTSLTQLQELIAPAGGADAGSNSIQTTVLATQPGSYYLQVADAHNVNFDATNLYTLTATYAADPDTHEPNDTTAQAKPSDSKPGWLAYLGDLDIFTTSAASANDLLTISITNPAAAPGAVNYTITSSSGTVLVEGSAPPEDKPFTTQQAVTAAGMYYLTLSSPTGTIPYRGSSEGYSVSFGTTPNKDTMANHTLATAACPGGGTNPCTMAYSGTAITLPTETSYLTVPGQSDFYRLDVTSGAALVLQIHLTSAASTPIKYAVDLLAPDPNSPCTADTDCAAIDLPCTSNIDDAGISVTTDCELSHACVTGNSKFCTGGTGGMPCSLCQGANLCMPSGVCAVPQYLSSFTPSGMTQGGPTVFTAQPLFTNGTYYLNVHDVSYTNTDLTNSYSLALQMVPEPDSHDSSMTAGSRNNFYNPYPSDVSPQKPNVARAVDITAQLTAGTPVTGWISYESDDDWFSFQHPCPGMNCELDFTWIQPGPSNVHVAFYMLDQDLGLHESFSYTGSTATSALTAPFDGVFPNPAVTPACSQCSFASSTVTDAGPYTYYLRIADVKEQNWDFSTGGQYSVTVKKGATGCPTACSEGTDPPGCYCFCSSSMSCPSPGF